jgi:DNA-binding NtrC family response regulator
MDDEEIIRETLKELLEHLGHNVTAVSSGEEAIKAYTLKKFDVVFLDITVKGGMGGKECIKELKKTDKKVRAIVYSGYPEEQVMINYREYGFCSSLKKPFTLDNLKKTLEECLKNNNGIN